MSVHRVVSLRCDTPRCAGRFTAGLRATPETRQRARRTGWSWSRDKHDYCPVCSEARRERHRHFLAELRGRKAYKAIMGRELEHAS